jgi:hypothetical protein
MIITLIADGAHVAPSAASVTSAGVNAPADLTVSGSPVIGSGTIGLANPGQTCTAGSCTVTAGVVLGHGSAGNETVDLPASNATRNSIEACKTEIQPTRYHYHSSPMGRMTSTGLPRITSCRRSTSASGW